MAHVLDSTPSVSQGKDNLTLTQPVGEDILDNIYSAALDRSIVELRTWQEEIFHVYFDKG